MISYISDLEGDWDHFLRFCALNDSLHIDSVKNDNGIFECNITLKDEHYFVYGGWTKT